MMMKRMVVSLAVASALALSSAAQNRVFNVGEAEIAVASPVRVDTREQLWEFATPLAVSRAALDELRDVDSVTMIGFPLNAAELVDLDLRRISVLDANAEIVSGHGEPRTPAELGRVGRNLILGGEVAGEPDSDVFLAITPTGTNGFIRAAGRTHMITSGKHRADARPMIFDLADLPPSTLPNEAFACNAIDPATLRQLNDTEITPERAEQYFKNKYFAPADADAPSAPAGFARTEGLEEDDCRVVNVAIETDAEMGAEFTGDNAQEALLDYVETLVGTVSFIYLTNINLEFNIVFVRDWIGEPATADPWDGLSTADVLFQLQDEWTPTSAPTNVDWQGVHFFGRRALGGGVAFVSAMCNQNIAHAVSTGLNLQFPVDADGRPVSFQPGNYDPFVVAHEWGHNLGAPHTHGVSPPIDGCAFGDCSLADGGTIMSYCGNCPGFFENIQLDFNPRIIDEFMRPYIEGVAPCNLIQPSANCDAEPPPECPADVNNDMVLNGADFSAWIIAFNLRDPAADINRDGQITGADFNAWLRSFNEGCDFGPM
jgi:hypothetical protein